MEIGEVKLEAFGMVLAGVTLVAFLIEYVLFNVDNINKVVIVMVAAVFFLLSIVYKQLSKIEKKLE